MIFIGHNKVHKHSILQIQLGTSDTFYIEKLPLPIVPSSYWRYQTLINDIHHSKVKLEVTSLKFPRKFNDFKLEMQHWHTNQLFVKEDVMIIILCRISFGTKYLSTL